MADQPSAFTGIWEAPVVDPSNEFRMTDPWYEALQRLTSRSNNSVQGPAGSNTDIQFNDLGAFGGSADLTWDKTTHQQHISSSVASGLRVTAPTGGDVALTAGTSAFNSLYEGASQDSSGNVIPDGETFAEFYQEDNPPFSTGSRGAGIEVQYGQTPSVPDAFNTGIGIFVVAPSDTSGAPVGSVHGYQYGGLGTGAVPGMLIFADRNDSGSGAASTVGGQQRGGTFWFIWQDATGAMRYGPARPTEDNSVSDTSGTLFATGTGGASLPLIAAAVSLRL